ncbi:phage tail protein [Altererythrobacter xixiisoli]|uniref:Phage tail protein n=1 Tax=Croceibacterium xixiisoli TaxID=1476466 RepID=A0A6I4TTG4_9SPHN|nr:portal protein [Croceibacterium xixiisoli]MXO99465.1 phage tail protein [Croceibacterium xixiisoli]
MASLRQHCEQRLAGLKALRSDYESEWQSIARYAQPARSRFLAGGRDKGGKRRAHNSRLLDPHGIEAFRTLTNGMMSGLTSSSRPWFKLRLGDPAMDEEAGARAWLGQVESALYGFLARTNFYSAAKAGYAEMGLFGTEACVMVDHAEHGAVCHSLTAGEYWIALSDAMVPDTLIRIAPMSARQAVQAFGEKAPRSARAALDSGDGERLVEIHQLIERDPDFKPDQGARIDSKPWRSIYWHAESGRDAVIRVAGYDEQPFWAPRWDVVGGDTWGVSPGMEALPALRELQMQVKRRNEAIDQMVKPEKVVKPGLRLTGEPGRTVSAAGFDRDSVLIPYPMPYQAVAVIGEEIEKCRRQIDGLSFAGLFNAITNMRGVQPRNMEEIAARNEEKLTQLGPVIENVTREKLSIAVERAYGIMARGQLLPPPPESIAGQAIDVEFVSILTQMQRAVGVDQIERTVGFIGGLAGAQPEVIDKLDTDALIDEFASRAGVPGAIIRGAADVAALRAQRAEAEQAAQQQAQMAQIMVGAGGGAEASGVGVPLDPTGGGDPAGALMQALGVA